MTNWAIIAPGNIAGKFANALKGIPSARCYAVAGRSLQRSQAFSDEFGFTRAYSDVESLLLDPAVDAIYIASPHSEHHSQTLKCLNAGKAVLCEKPMTVNALQANEIFAAAEKNQVFYMEAVWTRFLPIYREVRRWIDSGLIGEVRLVQANFGIHPKLEADHRLLNPDLAGGSILDLGIYPLTLADWVYDEAPRFIQAAGQIGKTGVDEQMAATLGYSNGRVAQIYSAVNTNTSLHGHIFGSLGCINIHPPFWGAESATLVLDDPAIEDQTIDLPHPVSGYVYEAEEVQRCLRSDKLQSPILPWSTSLRMIQTLDELRAQLGVQYPFET